MSEAQPQSRARGGSHRRGGFSGRGRGGATNGTASRTAIQQTPVDDDELEIQQLKKKYGQNYVTLHSMFSPAWSETDLVFALQETDNNLELTVEGITEGTISQWGEVSNSKKDRSKSKPQDSASTPLVELSNASRPSRGGRGGLEAARGGRGRATDRGRGTPRGRGATTATAATNGHAKENQWSVPTTESPAWDTPIDDKPLEEVKNGEDAWGTTPAAAVSSIIPDGVKKSWASMFAPAPKPKKTPESIEKPAEPVQSEEPAELSAAEPEAPIPQVDPVEIADPVQAEAPTEVASSEIDTTITPSKDELTETNLEQVLDVSAPAPSATAASTAASSWDPRATAVATPPYPASQQQVRPASGYQASALKATGAAARTPSFQRRILDQEEAVRMPGNREVDRAAVQFGAFNLNGNSEDDVDGDREEPETRAQPPQHSPVAPRAALPPAPQQSSAPESFPTPKQTTGLPTAPHPTAAPGLPSPPSLSTTQPGSQGVPQTGYGRYGQPGAQETSLPQKPYDAFSQQAPAAQGPFDGYGNQSQAQPPQGGATSAQNEYSSYYSSDPQQARQAYNNYYQQQYGLQQGAQGQQDGPAPQRSFSGYNNGPQAEGPQFPQSSTQPQARYIAGEGQNSGHTTPNPVTQSQQHAAQSAPQPGQPQSGQPGHPQQQQQQANNYPYGHPYYSSPYYAAYMNHYQQYGGGNYGSGPYAGKAGVHNQQPYQGYMAPGAPYEQHASSPAAGGFGSSLHGRDSALGGALGEYGRAGSTQSSQTPQGLGGSGSFGGAQQDPFGRAGSYPGQNHYNGPQGNQPSAGDDLKPFGESKTANGPSPSLSQAGRPGSATNTAPGSALPPPQSQQSGYAGYPSHLQGQQGQQGQHGLHGSQGGSYAGLGSAGHQAAAQGHQASQYGGGYQGFGNNYYGSQQQRGGWGGNYGHN